MEITQKNVQIAKDILKIMNEQQCTVAEANDILAFVRNQIYTTTTVKLQPPFYGDYSTK